MASRLISEDRRKYVRATFPEASQPILQVGPQAFAVVDISAGGLRLRKDDGTQLGGWISGRILFGDREPIKIDGIVVRNQDGDLGLHFATPMAFPVTK